MILTIKRHERLPDRTLGEVLINSQFVGHSLEDIDRGLTEQMTEEEILKIKVDKETAIPTGTYELILSFSMRFKKLLPLLVGVKGFSGVRIHGGNEPDDTEGCILTGKQRLLEKIFDCKDLVDQIVTQLQHDMNTEKSFIQII